MRLNLSPQILGCDLARCSCEFAELEGRSSPWLPAAWARRRPGPQGTGPHFSPIFLIGALAFPGAKGGPLRRGNFNKMSAWPHAVESIGVTGLHFHDLRHTGNQFAAQSGARLRDLMARMGHDSERAAMIYQYEAQGADKAITNAIDTHVQAEQTRRGDDEDGPAEVLAPAG